MKPWLIFVLLLSVAAQAATVTGTIAGTGSTANTTSYASSSFTPVSGDLVVVLVGTSGTALTTATMTDSVSLGFTLVATAFKNTSLDLSYIFVANTLSSGAAMTVTFDCTGDAATGAFIKPYTVQGMARAGLSAFVQEAKSENQAASGTPSVTFGQALNTNNPTIGIVTNATAPATLTQPTSWLEDGDTSYSTPTTGVEFVHRNSGSTATTVTWGSTSGTAFSALMVELNASAAPAASCSPAMTLLGVSPCG